MISLIDLVFIYTLYVIAIGIVYDFEITIFEALKKSITLPLTPFKYLISKLKPLTPLQKEIKEEERTIKQLEAQKADIQRLAELRQERESLFEEVGDKNVERVEMKRNGVWSEPDESCGDICADPTTMPDSVSSPHECPSCHTEAMMHYPGFKGYDWFCHNCQYKYQYGRN